MPPPGVPAFAGEYLPGPPEPAGKPDPAVEERCITCPLLESRLSPVNTCRGRRSLPASPIRRWKNGASHAPYGGLLSKDSPAMECGGRTVHKMHPTAVSSASSRIAIPRRVRNVCSFSPNRCMSRTENRRTKNKCALHIYFKVITHKLIS
jgi:hypothetical protein